MDLFDFNPLATDHQNGILDPGTPAGYEDSYGEEPYTISFDGSQPQLFLGQKIYFTSPFEIYALKAVSDIQDLEFSGPFGGLLGFSVRLVDVDGVALMNTRCRLETIAGVGMFPKPFFAPLWVPLGQYLTLDIENETGVVCDLQMIFCGLRRRKVR